MFLKKTEQQEWLTPVVEQELKRRKEEALKDKSKLLSHQEVMETLR